MLRTRLATRFARTTVSLRPTQLRASPFTATAAKPATASAASDSAATDGAASPDSPDAALGGDVVPEKKMKRVRKVKPAEEPPKPNRVVTLLKSLLPKTKSSAAKEAALAEKERRKAAKAAAKAAAAAKKAAEKAKLIPVKPSPPVPELTLAKDGARLSPEQVNDLIDRAAASAEVYAVSPRYEGFIRACGGAMLAASVVIPAYVALVPDLGYISTIRCEPLVGLALSIGFLYQARKLRTIPGRVTLLWGNDAAKQGSVILAARAAAAEAAEEAAAAKKAEQEAARRKAQGIEDDEEEAEAEAAEAEGEEKKAAEGEGENKVGAKEEGKSKEDAAGSKKADDKAGKDGKDGKKGDDPAAEESEERYSVAHIENPYLRAALTPVAALLRRLSAPKVVIPDPISMPLLPDAVLIETIRLPFLKPYRYATYPGSLKFVPLTARKEWHPVTEKQRRRALWLRRHGFTIHAKAPGALHMFYWKGMKDREAMNRLLSFSANKGHVDDLVVPPAPAEAEAEAEAETAVEASPVAKAEGEAAAPKAADAKAEVKTEAPKTETKAEAKAETKAEGKGA